MARRHAIDPIDLELVVEVKKGPDVVHENHAKLYHTNTRENDGVILKVCIKTLRLYKHVNEMKKDYRWNIFEIKKEFLYTNETKEINEMNEIDEHNKQIQQNEINESTCIYVFIHYT